MLLSPCSLVRFTSSRVSTTRHARRAPPRATPFRPAPAAAARRPPTSRWVMRLTPAEWAFSLVEHVHEAPRLPDGAARARGFDAADWSAIRVPCSWETAGFGRPIYTNTVYPFPVGPSQRRTPGCGADAVRTPRAVRRWTLPTCLPRGTPSARSPVLHHPFISTTEWAVRRWRRHLPDKLLPSGRLGGSADAAPVRRRRRRLERRREAR